MIFNTLSEVLSFCGGQRPKHLTVSLYSTWYTVNEVTYGVFTTRIVNPTQEDHFADTLYLPKCTTLVKIPS